MEIELIQRNEIEEFAQKSIENLESDIPITLPRAISQAKNPNAKDDDVLMVVAREGQKLLSFIGSYPSWVQNKKDKRIYWVSCWWKAKETPSKVSHEVLEKLLEVTKGEIGLPHLPAHIIKVLQKHNIWIHERDGIMIRFRLALHQRSLQKSLKGPYHRIIRAFRNTGLFNMLDTSGNLLKSDKIIEGKPALSEGFAIGHNLPGEEYFSFIHNNFGEYLTFPSREEIKWILNHPWLVKYKDSDLSVINRYHFSYVSDDFHYFFPVLKKKNELVAVGFFNSREGAVKSLYLFSLPEYQEEFFRNITHYIQTKRYYHTIVTYDLNYTEFLKNNIKRVQSYTNIKRYTGIGNHQYKILIPTDGDGDSCFT